MDTLGSRLKKLREEHELTLEYVAKKIGTTKVSISRYEKCEREPKGDMLNLLADFYGVTVDYLLGRTFIQTSSSQSSNNINDGLIPVVIDKEEVHLTNEQLNNIFTKLNEVGFDIKKLIDVDQ